jgi:hypothetical protein
VTKRSKKATKPARTPSAEQFAERRRHHELREVLDELIEHVRTLAGATNLMGPSEREYAQERLEWLAEEVWRLVLSVPLGD